MPRHIVSPRDEIDWAPRIRQVCVIAISPWSRILAPGFGPSNPVPRLPSGRGNRMPTKDEGAVALDQAHYQVDVGLIHVFRVIDESAV
jgi:hypothetical protein